MLSRIKPAYQNRKISKLEDVYRYPNLNIFSDASTRSAGRFQVAAYATEAVCCEQVVGSVMRIHSDSSNNREELRGLRGALEMGLRLYPKYQRINIFSDSLYSIKCLIFWPSYWVFRDGLYYNSSGEIVQNLDLVGTNLMMLNELRQHVEVNVYHIKGHLTVDRSDPTNYSKLQVAAKTFARENNIHDQIDLNLIRYLASYNNMADFMSRSILHRNDVFNCNNHYMDGLEFELQNDIIF